jgi:DNA-binding transcriptional MocR family regulator
LKAEMARIQQDAVHLTLQRNGAVRLVEQVAGGLAQLIEQGGLRSGERLPSVRQFAAAHAIGASTVVEAYEQLVARGLLVARRGAGFFIAAKGAQASPGLAFAGPEPVIDSAWLLSEMFADERVPIKAGCGWLPGKWLDGAGLHQAERRISRAPGAQQVGYGHPYGYAQLRQLIAQFLANWSLDVAPDQILTTHGAARPYLWTTRPIAI